MNSVVWYHGYGRETSWSDSSPEATTNGYHGRIQISYFASKDTQAYVNLIGSGNVNVVFSGNDGNFYNGTITLSSAEAQTTLVINQPV